MKLHGVLVQVLGFNGVSHLVVDDDLQAAQATLRWLSYLPIHVGDPTRCLPCPDPVDRPIEYAPPEGMLFLTGLADS